MFGVKLVEGCDSMDMVANRWIWFLFNQTRSRCSMSREGIVYIKKQNCGSKSDMNSLRGDRFQMVLQL